MKKNKIIYYASTGLLTAMVLMSVSMYFFKHLDIVKAFEGFGYPSYLIYPLGVAKLIGLVTLWFVNNKSLKEWAYAGFFFNFVLAFFAHLMISDGEQFGALIAIVLLFVSYKFSKQL